MTFGSSFFSPPGPDSLPESGSTSTGPRRKRLAGLSLDGLTICGADVIFFVLRYRAGTISILLPAAATRLHRHTGIVRLT
jgi:hypothetical protein